MENPVTATSPSLVGSNLSLGKFFGISDPRISKFISSIPNKFDDAVHSIIAREPSPATERVLFNRAKLAELASKFHSDAGTMTSFVRENILSLEDPQARILVATHQPNLFAYGGVFKKIVLLEALKRKVETVLPDQRTIPIFFVVDHDFLDETWMRVAQLPSLQSSDGIMDLRFAFNESQRWKMVCKVPLPNQAAISRWKSEIRTWIRANSKAGDERKRLMANLDDLWSEYEVAFSRAKSYADLNSFFMSRIVNALWNYSALFVRLSETAPIFEDGYSFLLANYDKYSDALRSAERLCMSYGIDTGVSSSSHAHAPLWLHCECGSKSSPKIINSGRNLLLEGSCVSCRKSLTMELGDPDNFDIHGSVGHLSPKAIPILLLLAKDLEVKSYISGTGGLGYLVDGQYIAKELGIPFPSVFVWSSRDSYVGVGQRAAIASCTGLTEPLGKRIETLENAHRHLSLMVRPLLHERSTIVRSGGSLKTILTKIYPLKIEQRRIRGELATLIKARNAQILSPCFVDYGVNFGVGHIEAIWRDHLDRGGSLTDPIIAKALTSIAV